MKNNKGKTNKVNKSGVYKLNCGTCPKVYIGQIGRSFKKGISENKLCFINGKTDSKYSEHLNLEFHDFNENFEILHNENKGLKLNCLESLEIK